MIRKTLMITTIIFSTMIPNTWACMWDYDTLAMERQDFPDTLELITGKFLRHSPAFYEWRIQDREARLLNEADNLALYDDLAVAYDKTGDSEKAIEVMLKKEALSPGLYETYANLGTFYIHSGRLEEGVVMIEKAIEINPDAHFGREVYQQHLVNYVMPKRGGDGEINYPLGGEQNIMGATGFSTYLALKLHPVKDSDEMKYGPQWLTGEERNHALKGVLGMMRFGNYDSPVLLEALGDILSIDSMSLLAARAYLKASYEVEDAKVKEAYREKAQGAVRQQDGAYIETLEPVFLEELAEAKEWYAQVEQDEARWIAEGKNLDATFSAKYYDEPLMSGEIEKSPNFFGSLIIIGLVLMVIVCIFVVLFRIKRSKKAKRDDLKPQN